MSRICEQCGKMPGVVNLNTAQCVDGSGPGPDMWLYAACLQEGINSPEAQALNQADTKKVALAAVLEDLVQSGFVADHLIAELRLARVIVDSGQRRDGKIVWVANSALSAEEFRQRLGALLRARFTDPAFQSFVDDPMIVADMAATDAAFQSLIDDGSIVPHPDGLQRPSPKTGKMQPVYVPAEVAAEIIEEAQIQGDMRELLRLAIEEVEKMDEKELVEVNEELELGVDLDAHNTTQRKRNAIIAHLRSRRVLAS